MATQIDAFRLPKNVTDATDEFIYAFINSMDFDANLIKRISRDIGAIDTTGKKAKHAEQITAAILNGSKSNRNEIYSSIIHALIDRRKTYFSFKTVDGIPQIRDLKDPSSLIYSWGEESWHGPIVHYDNSTWYIRPFVFEQVVTDFVPGIGNEEKRFQVRWLCFARLSQNFLSLHWRNFTSGDGRFFLEHRDMRGRFPYWYYIPRFFDEITDILRIQTREINLQQLILHDLWDRYRNTEGYKWDDIQIKAEHSGVLLNAKSRFSKDVRIDDLDSDETEGESDETIDIQGIKALAETIRKSILGRLVNHHKLSFDRKDEVITKDIDEEILRTLIREYNPQFYSTRIRRNNPEETLLHAKAYFGQNKSASFGETRRFGQNEEALVHFALGSLKKTSDIRQLEFILSHFDPDKHVVKLESKRLKGF